MSEDPGHADGYDRITLTWIRGRRPELRISEDFGTMLETIDLSGYTTRELHDLLQRKGFARKSGMPVPAIPENIFLRGASK
jgi:hypothetical protein